MNISIGWSSMILGVSRVLSYCDAPLDRKRIVVEPFNFGIGRNDADIYVDFSKKPQQTIVPGEATPIIMSADFDISKDPVCPANTWSVTVNYNNGSSPSVWSTPGIKFSELKFHIDDTSHIENVTTSLGSVIFPGPQNPFKAYYTSAETGT
jgi:hypothetical protein